jgi:homoserine O-succinyltransferase
MPDGALEATERQFLALLDAAADGIVVRLTTYALPDIPRTERGRRHVESFYSPVSDLWSSHLDGLIVTGTEPRAQNLEDEPYWESLTRVLEWAEHHTHSTVWSCWPRTQPSSISMASAGVRSATSGSASSTAPGSLHTN